MNRLLGLLPVAHLHLQSHRKPFQNIPCPLSFPAWPCLQTVPFSLRAHRISVCFFGTYVVVHTVAKEERIHTFKKKQAQTGHMVAEFEPHYQGLTALAWTSDSQALITASRDAQIKVFALSSSVPLITSSFHALFATDAVGSLDRLLEESRSRPRHYCVLNDHTGAISDISAGSGAFPYVRVLTSSTDGTVKVRPAVFRRGSKQRLMTSFLFAAMESCRSRATAHGHLVLACDSSRSPSGLAKA